MKRNIGSKLALYPMPITVIGAMNGDRHTWTLAGHLGIIGHDRVLVSLAAAHFINEKIRETKKLSINLTNPPILRVSSARLTTPMLPRSIWMLTGKSTITL